ncbi:MAG TPA: glycosyltransferase 87 family protein [Gaiellaceae bacterium]|nr:glycosyltransferase 87 family protein [Gaiellaceae bacterium]
MPRNGGLLVGDTKWAWLYLAGEIVAFAGYIAGLLLLRRFAARLLLVGMLAAAIQLAPLGAPLLISSDAWTYWSYGRIAAVHHANPYQQTPSDFPDDPSLPYVGGAWRDATSVYGPLFTLASEPVALTAGSSADAAAWLYKSLAALAMLGIVALTGMLARRRALAVALVGWNPLLALHFAGGGHNDAWMALLVMAALALAVVGRRHWAGAAWAGAILIKWVAVIFLPLRALEARAQGRRVGHLGFAAVAAAVALAATVQFGWHWLGAFGPLARNANKETQFALPHRLKELGVPHDVALGLFAAVFAVAYFWLARQAWRGRARLGLAAGFLLVCSPYLVPWYVVWALPLAASEDDPPAQWLAVAISVYLLRQRVPI